jgi:hypothetical protein
LKAQQKRGNQEEGNNKEGDDIIQPTPEFESKHERERILKRFERRKSCATVTPKVSSFLKKKVEKTKQKTNKRL